MAGLLDMGDDLGQLGGLLMAGTSPFAAVNIGNAFNQYAALQQQKRKEDRADQQAQLAQVVQTYKVLKEQDQQAQAAAAFDGSPYTPNPLLQLHEQKLAQLLGQPFKPNTAQAANSAIPQSPAVASPPPQSAVPPSVASQYSPVVAPGFQAQGPMPQPAQPPQAPQQQNLTIRMASQAAGIPDIVAKQMIAQGKTPELLKAITEALAPKNGPAGVTRINPQTGQVEIMAGNAAPGNVPFTRDPLTGKNVAQPIQGAAEEVARAEGLKTGAQEAAKAPYQTIDVPLSNGSTMKMPLSQFLARQGGQPPQPSSKPIIPQQFIDADNAGIPFNGTVAPDGKTTFTPATLSVTQGPSQGSGASFGVSQTPGAKAQQEGLTKGGVDYKNNLDSTVQVGNDLMMRIGEARGALQQFQPGMGAGTRLQVARAAQAMGLPDSVVEKINKGDISAKQEFMKLSAQQAMESLKQSLGGSGRITQAEFKVFQDNNPNISLDPNAIEKIYNFAQRVHARNVAEQAALSNYLDKGGDLTKWPAIWTQQQMQSGLMNKPATNGGFRYIGKAN